jgi:hypothetical protein
METGGCGASLQSVMPVTRRVEAGDGKLLAISSRRPAERPAIYLAEMAITNLSARRKTRGDESPFARLNDLSSRSRRGNRPAKGLAHSIILLVGLACRQFPLAGLQ